MKRPPLTQKALYPNNKAVIERAYVKEQERISLLDVKRVFVGKPIMPDVLWVNVRITTALIHF